MGNIIKAQKVVQNNQEFLLGVFKYSEVKDFTRYTHRIIVGIKEVDVEERIYEDQIQIIPEYNLQIQRKTNNAKVERIADFLITDPASMFPTNIVIAIPKEVIDSKTEDSNGYTELILNQVVKDELQKEEGAVFLAIIDGQHRIKGIEKAIERLSTYFANYNHDSINQEEIDEFVSNEKIYNRLMSLELIVTFFIDPILEYQAMIFSTINKTQTKVPENLVFSLFGLTEADTPQKTSLEVVLALNGIEKSPFYNRIKLVGGNYKRGDNIPLSQATMVKSILFNICKNQRESEIERSRERKDLKANPNNLPFRNYYATDNDKMIVRIMYSFFSAVRATFKNDDEISYWDIGSTETLNVLQANLGYQALMKILINILAIIPEEKKDDRATYIQYLEKAKDINWKDDGEEKRYPFTSKSVNILYQDLKEKLEL